MDNLFTTISFTELNLGCSKKMQRELRAQKRKIRLYSTICFEIRKVSISYFKKRKAVT